MLGKRVRRGDGQTEESAWSIMAGCLRRIGRDIATSVLRFAKIALDERLDLRGSKRPAAGMLDDTKGSGRVDAAAFADALAHRRRIGRRRLANEPQRGAQQDEHGADRCFEELALRLRVANGHQHGMAEPQQLAHRLVLELQPQIRLRHGDASERQ